MLIREETGIDCFLYVLNYASPRLTQEEVDTFETLKDVFGEKMFKKYCINIFTRGELFKGSIEEWIKGDQQSAKFKEIVQLCSNRVLMFNNEGDIMQKKKQRKDLLEMIDKIQNEEKYTNKNFEEAFQNRKKILETEGFKNIYTRVRDEVNNIRTAVDSLQLNPEADGFKDSLNNLDKEKTKLKSLYDEVKNEMGENITNVFDPLINQLKDGMDKIYMANFILLQHEYDQYKGSKLTDKEKIAVLSRQANALEIKAGVLQQDMNMFPSSLKTAELVNGMVSKIKDLRLQLSTSSKILNDLHDIFKGVGDARKKMKTFDNTKFIDVLKQKEVHLSNQDRLVKQGKLPQHIAESADDTIKIIRQTITQAKTEFYTYYIEEIIFVGLNETNGAQQLMKMDDVVKEVKELRATSSDLVDLVSFVLKVKDYLKKLEEEDLNLFITHNTHWRKRIGAAVGGGVGSAAASAVTGAAMVPAVASAAVFSVVAAPIFIGASALSALGGTVAFGLYVHDKIKVKKYLESREKIRQLHQKQ